jgi:hypothetical protein
VIPSASREGSAGHSIDTHSVIFFVISKYTPSNTKPKELIQYQELQQIIEQIRDQIIASQEDYACSKFFRLKTDSIHIDPEYNIFGGFLGWSMTLIF